MRDNEINVVMVTHQITEFTERKLTQIMMNLLQPRYEDMYPNCSEFRNISMLYVNESHLKCRTPKISSITLKVINCHAQVNCQFIRPIASVSWFVGKEEIINQTDYQVVKLNDRTFSLFIDNITAVNGSIKCVANGDYATAEIFITKSKCTNDAGGNDMNFVTISTFWLCVCVIAALVVAIVGAICMGYVITQCLESRTLPQLQLQDVYEASRAPCPLTESVLEPINLLTELPPPLSPLSTMPREFESTANETNYQTVLYDYPYHCDFY